MKKIGTFVTVLALAFAIGGASEAKAYGYTTYSYSGSQEELVSYLLKLIAQLQAQIEDNDRGGNQVYQHYYGDNDYNDGKNHVVGKPRSGNDDDDNDDDDDDDDNDDEPDVTTDSAENIDDSEAELNGEVDMNDQSNGEVFFAYGEDEDLVADIEDDYDSYGDIDEDGDDLQITLVDSDFDDSDEFSLDLFNLDEDTDYFFQICVGYEDEDDDDTISCGGVEEFNTDDNGSNDDDDDDDDNNDEEPEVTTDSAENISEDEAELHGEVDMNDFEDGLVFFVYGQDEDQVADIDSDYDTYSDIDEDDEDLQKMQVDTGLDDNETYWETAWGLDEDTDYFFQICVEYEDEDDDDTIICGGVEEFATDN